MAAVKRKGSMQLSIEAIIILVIAMVLLGLGIAFISGFFKLGTKKLAGSFDVVEFGCDPNANDPISVTPSEIDTTTGEQVDVKVCVYSSKDYVGTNLVAVKMDACAKAAGTGADPTILQSPQNIKKGDKAGYDVIMTAPATGTFICTLKATSTGSPSEVLGTKQVTVKVS